MQNWQYTQHWPVTCIFNRINMRSLDPLLVTDSTTQGSLLPNVQLRHVYACKQLCIQDTWPTLCETLQCKAENQQPSPPIPTAHCSMSWYHYTHRPYADRYQST